MNFKRRHSSRLLKPVYITQAEYTIEADNKPYTALYARRKDNADMTHFTLSLADRINRTAQGSRTTGKIKLEFKGVLRGFYSLPYTGILITTKKAFRGFCEAVAGIFSNCSEVIL